ncbi:RNA polymerase sigma factor [Tepidimicrobium xylanilyticum]|uniref:RNA polymerase sigma factor n=1 Tax=Tepidimicrobium xylanilyticum TaxID=1123352 RepID=UPI000B84A2A5|nr:sigma-70 family RNA polymerase sigma factor [Tepidimicrobium xylanilyticum]
MELSTKEFETLFKKYKGDIYRIAYTYVNNEADALDIVQETAYQAYISKDKIKDKLKFKSWLLKIAVNKSKDLLRKNKNILLDDLSSAKVLKTEEKESINMFMDNLKTLSIDEKNIIVLKIYFEYTFEIISDELKMPISTVKTKYYRALEKLKIEEGVYDR